MDEVVAAVLFAKFLTDSESQEETFPSLAMEANFLYFFVKYQPQPPGQRVKHSGFSNFLC